MTSKQQTGLSSSRILDHSSFNVDYLQCSICHDVLWKPVACQSCETPFCSTCINRWLMNNPKKCPNRCAIYKERKCPAFIAKLLAQLQIDCFYQSKGCQQKIPYEALDKHEIECDYQPKQCPGCRAQILKKDFDNHKNNCTSIELICQNCKLVYKRGDAATKHTGSICLKKQLRQLRDQSKQNKEEIQKLTSQWKQMCTLNPEFKKVTIKFDDLSSAADVCKVISNTYRGLKWTGIYYAHELFLKRNYPESGYVTSFIAGGSTQIAYIMGDALIGIERPDEMFTFFSVTACAAWNDNLQLTITGHRKQIQINTHTTILLFGKPQVILLQWKYIDKVTFKSSGGTAHPGSGQSALPQVVITQLTIGLPD